MRQNKENFSVFEDKDGVYYRFQKTDDNGQDLYKEIKLCVVKPTHKHNQKAQEVYSRRWRELAEQGATLRAQIPELLRQRKLWTEDMSSQEKLLLARIDKNWRQIKKGGIKLTEAAQLAKECISAKGELISLRVNQNQLDNSTAEALAEQERFNYLVASCTLYAENNNPFFSSYEEYLLRDETGDITPTIAGEAMWRLTSGLSEDFRKDWPEYQWLQKHKVVDDKLRFKRKDGRLVDFEGRLVNELGQYINDKNELVDGTGQRINDDGSPCEESSPFLDDDGKPIQEALLV